MQKKILPAIIICAINISLNAQIKKESIFLGGQIGFSVQGVKDGATNNVTGVSNNFNFSPAFGKAIKENLIVGADIVWGYSKYQPSYYQTQKANNYGAGIFFRSYKSLAKDFYLFFQTRLGYYYNYEKYTDDQQPSADSKNISTAVQLAIYPGIAYSMSKKLQLEAGFNNLGYIQYYHTNAEYQNLSAQKSITNGFLAGSNLSNFAGLTVGFRVIIE